MYDAPTWRFFDRSTRLQAAPAKGLRGKRTNLQEKYDYPMLASASGWQRYFFTTIALLVSAWIVWMLSSDLSRIEAIAYTLVLGGALGNAADRIMHGVVTDFLDFYWREWHWPAFNVADIAICGGAVALMTASFFGADSREKQQPSRD